MKFSVRMERNAFQIYLSVYLIHIYMQYSFMGSLRQSAVRDLKFGESSWRWKFGVSDNRDVVVFGFMALHTHRVWEMKH